VRVGAGRGAAALGDGEQAVSDQRYDIELFMAFPPLPGKDICLVFLYRDRESGRSALGCITREDVDARDGLDPIENINFFGDRTMKRAERST
jgi:hypothetical protein